MTFLNHARIDSARRYLESNELPINEIARRCGFDGTDRFAAFFIDACKSTLPTIAAGSVPATWGAPSACAGYATRTGSAASGAARKAMQTRFVG